MNLDEFDNDLYFAGLFHKVILQSGVVLSPWAFNECMDHGFRLAKKLGKTTSDPKVAYEFLKTIDAKILTKNAQWALRTEEVNISIFYYNMNYISSLIRYMCKY